MSQKILFISLIRYNFISCNRNIWQAKIIIAPNVHIAKMFGFFTSFFVSVFIFVQIYQKYAMNCLLMQVSLLNFVNLLHPRRKHDKNENSHKVVVHRQHVSLKDSLQVTLLSTFLSVCQYLRACFWRWSKNQCHTTPHTLIYV